jgi:hypothetical protein
MGPYGGGELHGMPTPVVDQLATEGMRLTQFPRRAFLHTVARSADDGSIFDPQRLVAVHRSGHARYAARERLHDGETVQKHTMDMTLPVHCIEDFS